jgi:hypothetical protein
MPAGLQEVRILSGISPEIHREGGGRKAACEEINHSVTISTTFR